MKVLGTSVPIFTSDFETAIERYEALNARGGQTAVRAARTRIAGKAAHMILAAR